MADKSSKETEKLLTMDEYVRCLALKDQLRMLALRSLYVETMLDKIMHTDQLPVGKDREQLEDWLEMLKAEGVKAVQDTAVVFDLLVFKKTRKRKPNQADQPPLDDGIPF